MADTLIALKVKRDCIMTMLREVVPEEFGEVKAAMDSIKKAMDSCEPDVGHIALLITVIESKIASMEEGNARHS